MCIFDTVTGALVKKVGPVPDVIGALAFSHDGKRLAAGLNGGHGGRSMGALAKTRSMAAM